MKFYNVSDTEKLMDTIRGCEGAIYARTEDGRWVNLKGFAEQAERVFSAGLRLGELKRGELEVVAERRDDAARLIRFMTQAASSAA